MSTKKTKKPVSKTKKVKKPVKKTKKPSKKAKPASAKQASAKPKTDKAAEAIKALRAKPEAYGEVGKQFGIHPVKLYHMAVAAGLAKPRGKSGRKPGRKPGRKARVEAVTATVPKKATSLQLDEMAVWIREGLDKGYLK